MRQQTAARTLEILLLITVCGCSGSNTPDDTPDATAAPPARGQESTSAAVACDPLPDMPVGRIAYTQVRDDGTAIYLMKPDGTDRRCLVDTAGPDASPAWSPDGNWVAFQGGTDERRDLYAVRADGTGLRQLTDTPEWESGPSWSPDGRRIAYSRSRHEDEPPWSIRVMAADGTHDTAILTSGHRDLWAEMRAWSPDGQTLLIATDDGGGLALARMDPDGSHRHLLRSEAGDFGSGAAYSPDGQTLVFQADLNGGCIYTSDPFARDLKRLTGGCSTGVALTWSPDGERILFAGGDGGGDLESMLRDGSQRRTIVDTGDVAQPDWQPQKSG